jgi:FKBP-type peptidyl-prolyl cis-trans isomerase FklB
MRNRLSRFLLVFASIPFVLGSCLNSDVTPLSKAEILEQNLAGINQTQFTADKTVIDDSLELWDSKDLIDINNVKVDPKGGVRYIITTLGTGPKPALESVIVAKYKGRLLKNGLQGQIFDESNNLQINLYGLITGWQTTLQLIPKGSVVKLFIPSSVAYGNQDIYDKQGGIIVIPKNSNLIFDIELTDVLN